MSMNELIVILLVQQLAYRSVNPRKVERHFQPSRRCVTCPSTADLRDLPNHWLDDLRSPSAEGFYTLKVVLEPRSRLVLKS